MSLAPATLHLASAPLPSCDLAIPHHPLTRDPALPCSGGIQWAWDDSLCKDTGEAHSFSFLANHSSFEEQFHEAPRMRSHPSPTSLAA